MKNEDILRTYYAAWQQRDWGKVASLLAEDFTFTSPNDDDDHLDTAAFKAACWPWPERFEELAIDHLFVQGDKAFVKYKILKKDGSNFHNVEFVTLAAGQIKEIQVFFGRPDTPTKQHYQTVQRW